MRLIDANAISEEISTLSMRITGLRAGKGALETFMKEYRKSVLEAINNAPAIDAVPIVHGYWKLNRNCSVKSYYCSVCLEGESDYGTENYCPNCGAKMDEVENG